MRLGKMVLPEPGARQWVMKRTEAFSKAQRQGIKLLELNQSTISGKSKCEIHLKVKMKHENENEIIEKIDIGGVSLIRAAAKNFSDVLIVSCRSQYETTLDYLVKNKFSTDNQLRKRMAFSAFSVIKKYDAEIEEYFGIIELC